MILVLAYVWLRLVSHLSIEWNVNEQYAYGWAVPFLCAYLLWNRRVTAPCVTVCRHPRSALLVGVCSIILFVFIRWIEIANPDWRLVSWALALVAIIFSLTAIYFLRGMASAKHFAFPILFFLVAVPWPTVIEQTTVQTLTRGIVAATVELLNAFGFPALPHGNVIETARGLVDVDQACSGIRSLQAALMLGLFFGELRRFTVGRRIALSAIAFALACFFNLARTVLLSLVAATQGPAAVQRWHDPAGIIILVACFIGVWGSAAWMASANNSFGRHEEEKTCRAKVLSGPGFLAPFRPLIALSFIVPLGLLLLFGEIAIHFWYANAAPPAHMKWTAALPRTNPTFKPVELPRTALRILRFNENESGTWQNADGTEWQMFYLRWQPGRTAANLARNHTPEICLPAAGKNLRGVSDVKDVIVSGLSLSFRCYVTEANGRPLFVFYTLCEDGTREQLNTTELLTWQARWKAVLERRRNPGQRVIEIGIAGARDVTAAEASLRRELPRLLHVQAER